jgi:hypothetical protein
MAQQAHAGGEFIPVRSALQQQQHMGGGGGGPLPHPGLVAATALADWCRQHSPPVDPTRLGGFLQMLPQEVAAQVKSHAPMQFCAMYPQLLQWVPGSVLGYAANRVRGGGVLCCGW